MWREPEDSVLSKNKPGTKRQMPHVLAFVWRQKGNPVEM